MELKVHSESDVVVAGGGPSGLIAALAAARAGAKTILVEQYGFLGGMATAASVGPFSPFHYDDQQITMGIPQELIERLMKAGGSTGHLKCVPEYGSGSYMAYFDREVYKQVAFDMMQEAGVRLLLHSFIGGAVTVGNRVIGIRVANKSGFQQVLGKITVDATGDGDVAADAGAEFKWGRESDNLGQPMTMFFEMAQVDVDALKKYVDDNPDDFEWTSNLYSRTPLPKELNQRYFVAQGFRKAVAEAKAKGDLTLGRDTVLLQSTMREGTIVFNSTRIGKLRGTDIDDFTKAEIEGRRQAMSLAAFMKKYAPGFANAYVSSTGVQIGVRESRHVIGEIHPHAGRRGGRTPLRRRGCARLLPRRHPRPDRQPGLPNGRQHVDQAEGSVRHPAALPDPAEDRRRADDRPQHLGGARGAWLAARPGHGVRDRPCVRRRRRHRGPRQGAAAQRRRARGAEAADFAARQPRHRRVVALAQRGA